jgi:3-oxoacyl-[acyl-carrier-protein] synthase II
MNRVVVTGMAGLSPVGNSWPQIEEAFRSNRTGVVAMPEWRSYEGLLTQFAAPVQDFTIPTHYSRKKTRSMGRVSLLATRATELALDDAELCESDLTRNGETGVAYGSSSGSVDAMQALALMEETKSLAGLDGTSYLRAMAHTAAVNISIFFETTGRIIPSNTACTSGSQSIGYAYEAIKYGRQRIMIAGGAEELSAAAAAVFDVVFATSTSNRTPVNMPRPFDRDRDGLIVGEGACTLILEELESALERGAHVYAEIIGFGTNSDGCHVTSPSAETISKAIELALEDAELAPDEIGYVSAHATGTELGDITESKATYEVFKRPVPISSIKGHIGHTLGAAGSLEAFLTISMMNNGWFAPTRNLDNVDDRCAPLDFITGDGRDLQCSHTMSNNFAFGGINTSLVFRRWTS